VSDEFRSRVAVVTGGASGIGEACARRLAGGGATVVIADRTEARGTQVAADIGGAFVALDVSDADAIERAAAHVESTIGPVALLVTSAGILQPPDPPDTLPIDVWDNVMRINLRGTYLTCRAFAAAMLTRREGSIVTVASVTALMSTPLHAYGPGKAAIASLTQSLATEWGRSGIRVNAISPGATRTPALAVAAGRGERNVDALIEASALGRLVEPAEIAESVAFLLSARASAITGINLVVDAGWVAAGTWYTYGGVRPAAAHGDGKS
jgi:NAD(P)-dependent dehydrogenase (short-subunit alcohol dehydrogenase family)